jgi:hypothetical protein
LISFCCKEKEKEREREREGVREREREMADTRQTLFLAEVGVCMYLEIFAQILVEEILFVTCADK